MAKKFLAVFNFNYVLCADFALEDPTSANRYGQKILTMSFCVFTICARLKTAHKHVGEINPPIGITANVSIEKNMH